MASICHKLGKIGNFLDGGWSSSRQSPASGQLLGNGFQRSAARPGQQVIHGGQRALPGALLLVHIEQQGFEQVLLGIVPKAVGTAVVAVLDDHVGKDLGHQVIAVDLTQAIPGIRTL